MQIIFVPFMGTQSISTYGCCKEPEIKWTGGVREIRRFVRAVTAAPIHQHGRRGEGNIQITFVPFMGTQSISTYGCCKEPEIKWTGGVREIRRFVRAVTAAPIHQHGRRGEGNMQIIFVPLMGTQSISTYGYRKEPEIKWTSGVREIRRFVRAVTAAPIHQHGRRGEGNMQIIFVPLMGTQSISTYGYRKEPEIKWTGGEREIRQMFGPSCIVYNPSGIGDSNRPRQ